MFNKHDRPSRDCPRAACDKSSHHVYGLLLKRSCASSARRSRNHLHSTLGAGLRACAQLHISSWGFMDGGKPRARFAPASAADGATRTHPNETGSTCQPPAGVFGSGRAPTCKAAPSAAFARKAAAARKWTRRRSASLTTTERHAAASAPSLQTGRGAELPHCSVATCTAGRWQVLVLIVVHR